MVSSANLLPMAQAWLDLYNHILDYFRSSKMSSTGVGYPVAMIFIVCGFLLIIAAVFRAVRGK